MPLLASGVPVFAAHDPGPFRAGLVLGVGHRDEGFVERGLTQLLVDVVMSEIDESVDRAGLDCTAGVGLSTTEFTVGGAPEQVEVVLRRICELLANPPVDRVADLVGARGAGADATAGGPLEFALGARYGFSGVGVAALVQPAMLSLTAAQVAAWSRRWATTAGAALWSTRELSAALDLPLGVGLMSPTKQERAIVDLPAWSEHPFEQVSATVEAEHSPASRCALRILRRRVEVELTCVSGPAASVGVDEQRIDGTRSQAGLVVAAAPGRELDVVLAVRDELAALAADGPTAEELAHDVAAGEQRRLDPCSELRRARERALAHVRGWPAYPSEPQAAQERLLTEELVRAAAQVMAGSLLVGVPLGISAEGADLPRLPVWSEDGVDGTTYRRRMLSTAPRGAHLIAGEDGVTLVLGPGARWTVRWDDVIGLVDEGNGTHVLVGALGWSIPVTPDDWRHGERALATVQEMVPVALQVRADPIGQPGR